MAPIDYDVIVCSADHRARELARRAAAALTRRGFRVLLDDGERETAPPDARQLALIAATPDFVLVTMADGGEQAMDERVRDQVRHAVAHERNVVRFVAPPPPSEAPAATTDNLGLNVRAQSVKYDDERPNESFALLAHHLSSDGTVDERRTMRRAKRFFWAAALILLAGIALQEIPILFERWSRPRLLAPVPPFALNWVAIGQRQAPAGWESFPVTGTTALRPGDQLRVVFSTSADGSAYVISRDVRGNVSVLFPTDTVRGASRVKAGEQHVAPVDGGWLTVDDESAPAAIFLVAGYDPLQNFEELIEEPEATTVPAARRALLESTIAGLLDGRHGAAERRIWTGKLHPIDPNLPFARVKPTAAVALASGRVTEQRLTVQPGLVSASVELRFSRE